MSSTAEYTAVDYSYCRLQLYCTLYTLRCFQSLPKLWLTCTYLFYYLSCFGVIHRSWEKISLLKIIYWCWLSVIFYFLVCLQTIPYPNYSWMLIRTDHAVDIRIIIFKNFWCIGYQRHAILTWSSQTNSIMFYFISDRQWALIDVCWLNHNADHGITVFAKTFSIICHLKKSWGRLLYNITYL